MLAQAKGLVREQLPAALPDLMSGLERFINDDALFDADPLIKMALIHHQFESIHPFVNIPRFQILAGDSPAATGG